MVAPKPIELVIQGVTARYGRKTVLKDFATERPIQGGHVTGLLGPNASGKSTLIRSLVGKRKDIGYVPQEIPDTAALSALETVLVGARRAGAVHPVEAAASTLTELGVGHVAGRRLRELSGGQRQLVAVAQMLVAEPNIMLLDEPTSALDLHRQLFLLHLLRQRTQQRGAVALVAIHDINLAARMCGELVVMHEGELITQGTPQEVITPDLLREVYRVEAQVLRDGNIPVVTPLSTIGVYD
ncbi:ABC transporter ATP-binding protein [Corynebacterium freiburgense]|uniref:ABC transporter ATP-binding protein n=1 Tax=Corynebacterium freiburgense TaxID=556548 RepID=UPI0003FD40D9|nr:ABC transporter ATP-binding protein [Corynebacterium freiburgense]WJZ03625.1 Iron(3+)-hydroxamate import ATP-binding protein FhuC [Corynebacterium freiburgense]